MKNLFILIIFISISFSGFAQKDTSNKFPVIISVFNNATLLPGSGTLGIINTPLHPGVRIGTYINLKETNKKNLFLTFNMASYYHKLSQTAFQFYPEFCYMYKFKNGIGINAQVLAGYLLAKPDLQVFKLDNNGNYQSKTVLRSQIMTGVGLGVSYKLMKNTLTPLQIFLNYQFYLQMPFVKNYVPMLPNTALHIGTVFYFHKKRK